MNCAKIMTAVAVLAVLAGCGSREKQLYSPNEPMAIDEGIKAAERVVKAAPGMEQEKAILAIRAKEQEIRQTGDSLAADAFASAAKEYLDSVGILKSSDEKPHR